MPVRVCFRPLGSCAHSSKGWLHVCGLPPRDVTSRLHDKQDQNRTRVRKGRGEEKETLFPYGVSLSMKLEHRRALIGLLSDARILADSIGNETAFIICAESEEVQKRTLELEQQTASKLAEGGESVLTEGPRRKGEAGDAYAAMHRILRRGLLSFSPEKRRSGGSRKLLGRTGRGAACAAAQKKGDAERAEKRGERGNPEGERAHRPSARLRKNEGGHGGRGCRECRECTQAAERRDSGGYAEARAWRGMRERSRRRAENAWKGPWGKLSFSGKLRGKRFRNSI